jgi:hypothetical protein
MNQNLPSPPEVCEGLLVAGGEFRPWNMFGTARYGMGGNLRIFGANKN